MFVSDLSTLPQPPAGIGSNSSVVRAHLQWAMWRQAAQERMGPRDQVVNLAAAAALSGVRLLHP